MRQSLLYLEHNEIIEFLGCACIDAITMLKIVSFIEFSPLNPTKISKNKTSLA